MVRGRTSSKGFTIVELLIVVVVIAILAAITIVSYTGITGRAYTASVQTEFRNAMQSIEKYKVENGLYPSTGTNTELAAANIRINTKNYDETGSNFLYCVNNTTSRAALTALGTNGVLYAQSTDRAFGPYKLRKHLQRPCRLVERTLWTLSQRDPELARVGKPLKIE